MALLRRPLAFRSAVGVASGRPLFTLLPLTAAARQPVRPVATRPASAPTTTIHPFPFPPLHVGTDICHIARVYALLAKSSLPSSSSPPSSSSSSSPSSPSPAARFIRRLLTPQEVDALVEESGLPSSSSTSTSTPTSAFPAPTATAAQVVAWLVGGGRPPTSPDVTTTSTPDPALWTAARHLAGRFAAKEAAIKAHPHLGLTLQAVRIVRARGAQNGDGSGPPLALVRIWAGEGTDQDPSQDGDVVEQEARLSISHDGEYATAVCVGFESPL